MLSYCIRRDGGSFTRELQQAAKATLAAVPVAASDQPSGPGARASPVLLPPAPVPVPVPTSTSTGQSRQLSSQSVLSCAQSGSTGTIPPCVPLAKQPSVPSDSIGIRSPWRMRLYLREFWIGYWALISQYL